VSDGAVPAASVGLLVVGPTPMVVGAVATAAVAATTAVAAVAAAAVAAAAVAAAAVVLGLLLDLVCVLYCVAVSLVPSRA
jgi:hypothetical protein